MNKELIKQMLIALQAEEKINKIEKYINNNKEISKADILEIIKGGDKADDYF